MAITKEQKLETQLRKAIIERADIDSELKPLEERKVKATARIKELMTQLGRGDYRLNDDTGFQLQRPMSTVYHQDAIKTYLAELAPKLVRKVFRKVEQFDRDAFEKLVEEGKVPQADEMLANDQYVELKPGTPRLTPMKPLKPTKEK